MKLIDELRWRGLLHDMIPGTEELFEKEMVTGYVGFDPTADSLHIGNLVPIMLLVHLQRAGHKPVALVGGATGMVGDPSGKDEERKLLDTQTLQHNLDCQREQLKKFLNFDCGEQSAVVVNNYDWFKDMTFLDFIRDVGKHITVNYMSAKDSVKNRMETGMSFTEFTYQLVQGYDFYHLWNTMNCKLQMGGSDQWGNITTGTELIRRKGQGDAYALTAPLLMRSDGKKFGKSEKGNVWLDAEKTSPYTFYQYWINVPDNDAGKMLRIFTLMTEQEIKDLEASHEADPPAKIMQKELAKQVTTLVHSAEDCETAIETSALLFGKLSKEKLEKLDERTFLDVFSGVETADLNRSEMQEGLSIMDALSSKTGFLKSNSEARRALMENAVSLNTEKVQNGYMISESDLLFGKFLLLQKGKKNHYLIRLN